MTWQKKPFCHVRGIVTVAYDQPIQSEDSMRIDAKRVTAALLAWALLAVADVDFADSNASPSFTPDPKIEQMAQAYAQGAVDFAAKQFAVKLDWSDASIANVEKVLAQLNSSYTSTAPKPTDEQVMSFAKGFGSYVGEVYRRNHGGEWGMVTLGGNRFPGLQTASGTNFWPWARAFNRITKGSENNIADYYGALLKK
ncbi:hypothetical protein [Paraburkholderia antibiotica]|uniref:Uncharacterized protein n=1 Tax=Paraburkholderia antibiotica TaxID=2728839 RepID=A0A7Y0FGD9_9BURK|nr:hypothetical protein [Paraburkholderia antibiotica]NML35086.1 hypothetical protein [Paraburkholderia antibiotica]